MTSTIPPNPKSILKVIIILHSAFCLAILIFGITTVFITDKASISFTETDDIFFYLVPMFAITLAVLSQLLYQRNLTSVHKKTTLIEKLTTYQSIRIIRYAMLEAPALLGIVIFIITDNQYYIIISAVILAFLVLLRPTKTIIKDDLKLNSEQEKEYRDAMR